MWASVQTIRGCPKHCSFCSVWRTDGQQPRQRHVDVVVDEIVELRRKGYRFIALADDNFYPVSQEDLRMARRRADPTRLHELEAIRAERFELMERLAELPRDMVFFTQITMEAAEDTAFLDAMRNANIKGALVGVEAVTPEGLKDVYKGFNVAGEALVERLQTFRTHGVHVLGSFIFGLPSDRPSTFEATAALAQRAGVTFAQFVMLTPFPGTLDFNKWEETLGPEPEKFGGIPVSRHWLIPQALRPKVYTPHPVMGADEIRERTQGVWDKFYSLGSIWQRSTCVKSLQVAAGVRADLEALSPDVRQHRHRDRQRARLALGAVGAADRQVHAAAVRGAADAGADGAGEDGAAAGRPGAPGHDPDGESRLALSARVAAAAPLSARPPPTSRAPSRRPGAPRSWRPTR